MNAVNSSTLELVRTLDALTSQIDLFYSAIVIPTGILLNLLTIFIFATNKHYLKSNLHVLYIGMGIYDIFALLNSILFAQFLPALNIILVNQSPAACIALNWYRKVVIQAPSWCQVLLTIERYSSVAHVHRLKQLFKSRRQVISTLLSLIFVLIVVNVSHAWLHVNLQFAPNQTTQFDTDYSETSHHVLNSSVSFSLICSYPCEISIATDTVNVLFRFLLPFVLMLVLNVFVTKGLYESKRRAAVNSAHIRSFTRERHYTTTVIGFNVLFFFLNLPWAIWFVLAHLQSAGLAFTSTLDAAVLNLLNAIVFSIFYLNNLSSFILNLAFNKLFRAHFFYLTRSTLFGSSNNNSNNNSIIHSHNRSTTNVNGTTPLPIIAHQNSPRPVTSRRF